MELLTYLLIGVILIFTYVYLKNKHQKQHSVLRRFPLIGIFRGVFENLGPEFRQYITDSDTEGRPYHRTLFHMIVFMAKYGATKIGFGGKRNYEQPNWYLTHPLFSKQKEELDQLPNQQVDVHRYKITKEWLTARREHRELQKTDPWLLNVPHTVGAYDPLIKSPWVNHSPIGSSGMSYGSIGKNATLALAQGTAMARTWINTGEGGLAPYHLQGKGDVLVQLGPANFGFRDKQGYVDWKLCADKMQNDQIVGIEVKLHQGAKIRGGHLPGKKVTPDIAEIRGVTVGKAVDSPNRNPEFSDRRELLDFLVKLKETTGKPVGIKIVVGNHDSLEKFVREMQYHPGYPNFITVDGGEGGSGATFSSMADSMGLPVLHGLPRVKELLKAYHLDKKVHIIASGKLATADKAALALALGADMVAVARPLMISLGCIMAEKCHTNTCPTGVATTDPKRERALVPDEKKDRVASYFIAMREELFALCAALGVASPHELKADHVEYVESYRHKKMEHMFVP